MTDEQPKFGINIPQFNPQDSKPLASLGEFAAHAERLGFDSLWTLDGSLHDTPFLEPLTSLAFAAAVTKRVRLGTAVLLLPIRHPIEVAKMTANIDFLSSGRFILGAALGGSRKEYDASGVPMQERVPRFVETLRILRRLWTEDRVVSKGRFWDLDGVTISPRPARAGGIPIWMGGSQIGREVNEKALKRAARLGDGWLGAGSTSFAAHINSVGIFLHHARSQGKPADSLAIAKRVYIHVDANGDAARDKLAETLGAFYHRTVDVDALCAYGPAEDCVTRLKSLREAGTKTIVFNPVVEEVEQAERIMNEVVPSLVTQ